MSQTAAIVLIEILWTISSAWSQSLTYTDLVARLTDLERLASLPAQGEYCKLSSSYDRKSYYDETAGKYVNWDSNGDGFGGKGWIRIENDQLVLAEMDGPGCIWRIWSATPRNGHVRIYLDGNETPAVDLPFADYFNRTQPPFDRPSLVYVVASGKNNFVPIPFQTSCKIVADKDYGEFHHFTYTMFPQGTKVPTFKMELSPQEAAALDAADRRLSSTGPDFTADRYPEEQHAAHAFLLEPGSAKEIEIQGVRAITSLKIHLPDLSGSVERQREILRELTLRIRWDGQADPAVWSPLGDFFGSGPGLTPYKSLPMGMTDQWLYSNWFMPFEKGAVLTISNEGCENRRVELELSHMALNQTGYARFHAKWHRDVFLPKEPERWIDWTLLTTQGAGRLVGVNLQIWNPRGGWWGEGDEKFFVDGERFPSTYGTGSEDYFGYAWSDPALFSAAYHSQPISEGNQGHISVNRWHIADNVPFHESFEGCIEKYWANDRPTIYTAVVYWYLDKNGKDPYSSYDLARRIGYYTPLRYPMDVAGMIVLDKPAGQLTSQGMHGYPLAKWDGNDQLWWTPEKIGDRIKMAMDVPAEGAYKILTRLTKAPDYGIVQFYLNDQKIGQPIDLYYKNGVTATDQIDLGTYDLGKGSHTLIAEIAGGNPAAIQRYMFGMDYLKIQKK